MSFDCTNYQHQFRLTVKSIPFAYHRHVLPVNLRPHAAPPVDHRPDDRESKIIDASGGISRLLLAAIWPR